MRDRLSLCVAAHTQATRADICCTAAAGDRAWSMQISLQMGPQCQVSLMHKAYTWWLIGRMAEVK